MQNKKEIGGYFEMELQNNKNPFEKSYHFNFARNAIAYYFKSLKISTVHIPTFLCKTIAESLVKNNISIKYYNINNILSPEIPQITNLNEGLLIVNHFGLLNNDFISSFNINPNVLIDNSHAFFFPQSKVNDCVFSPRKYFGIVDGAYLKTKTKITSYSNLAIFNASPYTAPLMLRLDGETEKGFMEYKINQKAFSKIPIMKMSKLSTKIMESIDFKNIKDKRINNFRYLKKQLSTVNILNLDNITSTFCYPLLLKNGSSLREKLIFNKIFIPKYWEEVLENQMSNEYDKFLTNNIIALPIDQRYSIEEMKIITNLILQ